MPSKSRLLSVAATLFTALALPFPTMPANASTPHEAGTANSPLPSPQIFAPGVVSGPANDGPPTFSPDGNTIFFSRSSVQSGGMIVESHKIHGHWSHPTLARFSGEWPDSAPALSPDGSFLVFQSSRPTTPIPASGSSHEIRRVSNLWRVERVGAGWSTPQRLPDTVNIGDAIWKPSVAADGSIYFVSIDKKGAKRLYSSQFANGIYAQAQPLPFSDGTTLDVDPEIAPDGSFLVFCSAGRLPGDSKDHLFIVLKSADGWGPVTPIRYAGDDKSGYSTDDEPHLGPDHLTVYFSSDRAVPLEFPRTHEQAQQDFKRLDSSGWFGVFANVWSIPISAWLTASETTKLGTTK